jgi:ribonuclease HIII
VPDYKESSEKILKRYIRILKQKGINASSPKLAQYNYQSDIVYENTQIKLLVYFGKKGNKVVLQGDKEFKSYKQIYQIIFGEKLFDSDSSDLNEPECYIGTDESGKGDYFGPLVIAGALADNSITKELKLLGVKDSKELTDSTIKDLAIKIKKIKGAAFDVVLISPEKYNQLYDKMGNLNNILGWAHAKVIENILKVKSAPEAISDKFGNEKYISNSLQEKGRELILHQVTKAEQYSAVAAASILARDAFNNWFCRINKEENIKLPKGASNNVEEAARKIKMKLGDDTLTKLAKLHFKTTKRI